MWVSRGFQEVKRKKGEKYKKIFTSVEGHTQEPCMMLDQPWKQKLCTVTTPKNQSVDACRASGSLWDVFEVLLLSLQNCASLMGRFFPPEGPKHREELL